MPKRKSADTAETVEKITAIKGFNRDLTCRRFQFAEGKTYVHEGEVKACESGFHAIEGHPLEVLGYYAPGQSVYHEVEMFGPFARHDEDSKIAGAQITIKAEIHLPELIDRAVKWVFAHAKPENTEHATGDWGAASATGNWGAASATGTQGAASATGTQGAASATGNWGAASATGNWGAASATGTQGAASATGDWGAAMSSGYGGRVSGSEGNALFAVERGDWDGDGYPIISVAAGIVGQDGIKPDVWYRAKDGKLVGVEE